MSGLATYVVEPRISRFQVQAFSGGLLSALGHNPVFAIRGLVGDASIREDTMEEASLVLRVDATSLHLTDDISERDREEIEWNMHRDVLETDRFPEIMFVTEKVEVVDRSQSPVTLNLEGNITLHGQTRAQNILTKVSVNHGFLRAFGEFSIWQTDYNIRLVSVAGGTLKIKDQLKLNFDIVARRLRDTSAEAPDSPA
jgi:polyisoprenoid-binding protein YceI